MFGCGEKKQQVKWMNSKQECINMVLGGARTLRRRYRTPSVVASIYEYTVAVHIRMKRASGARLPNAHCSQPLYNGNI